LANKQNFKLMVYCITSATITLPKIKMMQFHQMKKTNLQFFGFRLASDRDRYITCKLWLHSGYTRI